MKRMLLKFLTLEQVETTMLDFEYSLRVATAVLLIEVIRADFKVEPVEWERLSELLREQFKLDQAELDALLEQAQTEVDQLVSIQHVTRVLNDHYDHAMKLRVVEMMWQLVYADGEKDRYEEHLLRQIADLLYVSHSEFIQARHKAEDEQ